MDRSVSTSPIHGEGEFPKRFEARWIQMLSFVHRPHNVGPDKEFLMLRAKERLRLEEGDDFVKQVRPLPDDEHQRGVSRSGVICLHPSATQASVNEVEDLPPLA
jgi:hypothetical protein